MTATLTSSMSPAGFAPESTDLGAGRRRAILAAVCLALALVVAGVAMLNVALPTMTRALGASQSDQQWIVDGYTVALAALLLFAGALGDRFGRRRHSSPVWRCSPPPTPFPRSPPRPAHSSCGA